MCGIHALEDVSLLCCVAILLAALSGNTRIVELLLDAGVDVAAVDKRVARSFALSSVIQCILSDLGMCARIAQRCIERQNADMLVLWNCCW